MPTETVNLARNLFTRVTAEVRIDGRGPYRFVIDTGAQTSAISDHLAQRLGLAPSGKVRIHGVTMATAVSTVEVESLTLGVERFRNLKLPVLPIDNLRSDGLIGLDVLSRFRLTFDISGRRVILDRGGFNIVHGPTEDTGTNIRTRVSRAVVRKAGQIILTNTLAGNLEIAAFVDTGAQFSIGNLALLDAAGRRDVAETRLREPVEIFGVTGDSVRALPGSISSLRLGMHRLMDVPVLFADLHCFRYLELNDRPSLLLGSDIVGRFRRVSIDFLRARVRFERPLATVVAAV